MNACQQTGRFHTPRLLDSSGVTGPRSHAKWPATNRRIRDSHPPAPTQYPVLAGERPLPNPGNRHGVGGLLADRHTLAPCARQSRRLRCDLIFLRPDHLLSLAASRRGQRSGQPRDDQVPAKYAKASAAPILTFRADMRSPSCRGSRRRRERLRRAR